MDNSNYIPAVTINNVVGMGFKKMLNYLKPYTQEHIPEGILGDQDAYVEIERLIGRLANIYAYLIHLYSHVANQATLAKRQKQTDKYDRLMRKRDALYELARAVRYKHEACSRMLTAALEYSQYNVHERVDGKAREEKAEKRRRPSTMKGWGDPL